MRTRYLREYLTKIKGVKNGTARWKNSVSCRTMNSMWMPAMEGIGRRVSYGRKQFQLWF